MNALPQNIIALLALFLSLLTLGLNIWLIIRLNKLLKGSDGKSLESAIKGQGSSIEKLLLFKDNATEYFKFLDKRIKQKVSNVELARFNPFQGTGLGGNNSFSASFVDEEGNGIVMSGLHTRERTNIFTKPLTNWQSQNKLSKEENGVVQKSKEKIIK